MSNARDAKSWHEKIEELLHKDLDELTRRELIDVVNYTQAKKCLRNNPKRIESDKGSMSVNHIDNSCVDAKPPVTGETCGSNLQMESEKIVENESKKGSDNMDESMYYSASDVQKLLGVSRGKAYKLIKELNDELSEKGYIVLAGKIPKRFFVDKFYGVAVGN